MTQLFDKEYLRLISERIIASHNHRLSTIKPSDWAEENRVLSRENSPFPGPISFDKTPYARELADCFSPDHPARIIAIMKGSQLGISTMMIENIIGWIIAENPGGTLFLSGTKELSKEMIEKKVDQMIHSCGIQHLIRPNTIKKRKSRTGDTSASKEFPDGWLIADGVQNADKFRQRSARFGLVDDIDAAKKADKGAGNFISLIETRFMAYYSIMKLAYISTPQIKQTSNIEPLYLKGDQRKWYVPCPKCGEYIVLEWRIKSEINPKNFAGIHYEIDNKGKLIDDTVGYICQKCDGFFTEKHKYEMNLAGHWKPTQKPSEPGFYSYHLSALYAPAGMCDWQYHVRKWLDANPSKEMIDKDKLKTFLNTSLGQSYEEIGESPKADKISSNTRPYSIGIVPNELSIKDNNGIIIMLTCAADLGGEVDDARLDYEVVAWSERGASYSIEHGSIGTFKNRQKKDTSRIKYTYRRNKKNNVWDAFNEIIERNWPVDDKDRTMRILITGIDSSYFTNHAYDFVDKSGFLVFALKGDKEENAPRNIHSDTKSYKLSNEKSKLYILYVNQIKDRLSKYMGEQWDLDDDFQPSEFMNFPTPERNLYTVKGFFSHFEAEHKILETDKSGITKGFTWTKKSSTAQNHFWDCRVYNIAMKEIFTDLLCKKMKTPYSDWATLVKLLSKQK